MIEKTQEQIVSEFCQLLYQSELSNLVANKELTPEIFNSLICQDSTKSVKLANGEYMDLYLCENLFSTLLPGLESLAKTSEKLIYYFENEVQDEVDRFNPCNFLAEFLMRNNPKYAKNKKTHQKFLKFTRKERKRRMIADKKDVMIKKVSGIYNKNAASLNKLNMLKFVENADAILELNGNLKKWSWLEHFRVKKDNQTITLQEFLVAFEKAFLDLHEIDEEMTKKLLDIA